MYTATMGQDDEGEDLGEEDPHHDEEEMVDRMEVFLPVVQSLVNALGGYEDIVDPETKLVQSTYLPGDSCLAVLRDLKKLWRKDDTDDERTVFRCFYRCHLARELVALIDECVGRGDHERKIALAAADLLAALTWPIDVAQELKELAEDDADVVTDYASLLRAQVEYKALLLQSNTLLRIMQLLLPCLARIAAGSNGKKFGLLDRQGIDKDKRIVSLVLHLVRNLLAIRDPIANGQETGEKQEFARLQSTLILQLQEHRYLSLFLSLASNAGTTMYNDFNVLILDCWFLMLRGIDPNDLAKDPERAPMENLTKLLDHEESFKRSASRTGTSRHSRFGTTISIMSGANRYILHKQKAVSNPVGGVIDSLKHKRAIHHANKKERDELGTGMELTVDAMKVLQEYVTEALMVFDAFFSSILKDIRLSRSKVRETDNLRTLYLCRFFMEYLLAQRNKPINMAIRNERTKAKEARKAEKARLASVAPAIKTPALPEYSLDDLVAGKPINPVGGDDQPRVESPLTNDEPANPTEAEEEEEAIDEFDFGYVAEMFEDDALRWINSRLNQAQESNAHVEYQACLDMSSILLAIVNTMQTDSSEEIKDAGLTLMDKLFYNGEYIDNATKTLKLYKSQSMSYLDSAVKFAYTMYQTLEKYAESRDEIHFRKRRAAQLIKLNADGTGEFDEEEVLAPTKTAPSYSDHKKNFQELERMLADEGVCKTLVRYLALYKDFKDPVKMKRLIGLMHRIAVNIRKEGFFFKVSGFSVFKQVLDDQRSLPAHQSSKDAVALINFILRKFFKGLEQDPFLAVDAFFPKASQGTSGRTGNGLQLDSDDDGEASDVAVRGARKKVERIPADLEFKPDSPLTWSQQLGTAVLQLTESQSVYFVTWLMEQLGEISATRQQIILNTDGERREYDSDFDDVPPPTGPSEEAISKLEDFDIVCDTEYKARAVTFNPHLKLLMTLAKLNAKQIDVEGDEPRVHWTMHKEVMPEDIDATIRVMRDFLTNPIDLEGKTAAELLRNKRKKAINRKKRSAKAIVDSDNDGLMIERPAKRIKKRAAELQQFKSAAYIEDSDDAAEADEGFYRRELELREISRQKMMSLGHIAVVDDDPKQPRLATQKQGPTDTQMQVDSDDDMENHGPPATASIPNDSDDDSAYGHVDRARPLVARPAPRRRTKRTQATASPSLGETSGNYELNEETVETMERNSDSEIDAVEVTQRTSTKRRVVAESEEDD
ncbi:hypothetical protein QFC22_001812 [Naganishia vaughanmartiniae]|uniref:Uncharacterized protein n=1 Tax=Naganishia vaughanmartiniae TaxID=1424756 RepID=A0ACC2XFL5_9TREE|nr:hypothetical protein QFC22_001812 [Naganishia vaughanmartiniae]